MKLKKKHISIVIVMILSVHFLCFQVLADNHNLLPVSKAIIEQANLRGYSNIRKITPLYNNCNEVICYCIDFDNGYMISDGNGNVFEHSPETNSPYYKTVDKCLYAGPLNYYIERDAAIVDLQTNNIINNDSYNSVSHYFSNVLKSLPKALSLTYLSTKGFSITTSYSSGIPRTLDYNTQGSCGPLAFAIMLCYYYDYVSTSYLSTYYATYTSALHSMLINYYFPTIQTTYNQLVDGSNNYFSDMNINSNSVFQITSGLQSYMYFRINNQKKPFIMRLVDCGDAGNPWSIEHWLITYGYRDYYMNGQKYNTEVIVNDGWGHNQVFITYNSSYINGGVSFAH